MAPLAPGSAAPDVPGLDLGAGPSALVFYKVTCPVCQMTAPKLQAFERAYPGRLVGIGQDPEEALERFGEEFDLDIAHEADPAPYPLSSAYGVRVVPTVFLVRDGRVLDVVESWDRDGLNELSARLAELTDSPYAEISKDGDGLPPFRPG
jgi:thiol-disulfide isomerase/thioredoxin